MSKNAPGPRELELRRLREAGLSARAGAKGESSSRPPKREKTALPNASEVSPKNEVEMPKSSVVVEPDSKKAIVAGLLKRKKGCTGKEVKEATGWPSVSMPALAKSCGLKLRKEKTDRGMRYYGSTA